MSERYTVRVEKDYLVFSAAHFITFANGDCERLHGHNWRVAAELDGPLDAAHLVFDFIALKDCLLKIVGELDHRMLIPMKSTILSVRESTHSITIQHNSKNWIFPREDCALLLIENTTAELLAKYIGSTLLGMIKKQYQYSPIEIKIMVEEAFGQSATVRINR